MKKYIIKINGMVCGGCENRVRNILKDIEGIENVTADYTTGIVEITSKNEISKDIIKEKIENIGFEVVD